MGIASLVIGILALLLAFVPFSFGVPGMFLGLLAALLGLLGRGRLLEEGRSAGVAIGGLVAGILAFIIGATNLAVCLLVCKSAEWTTQMDQVTTPFPGLAQDQAAPSAPPVAPEQPLPGTPSPNPTQPPTPAGTSLPVSVNVPVAGVFTSELPREPDTGRSFQDYVLTIGTAGTYVVSLMSHDGSSYDPYLRLLLNGTEIANDDDGGGYPHARISQTMSPGTYVVRVSSFRSQPVSTPTGFTLTVAGG